MKKSKNDGILSLLIGTMPCTPGNRTPGPGRTKGVLWVNKTPFWVNGPKYFLFFVLKIEIFRFPKVAGNLAGRSSPRVCEPEVPASSARIAESAIRRCAYIPSLSSNSVWRQSYLHFPADLFWPFWSSQDTFRSSKRAPTVVDLLKVPVPGMETPVPRWSRSMPH